MNIERPISKQPMPPNAEHVFKGVIFDVYQWQQDMYDGTKRTFEKLTRQDAAVVIAVTEANTILVTYQEQPGKEPFSALPGGHLDVGESPIDAAKRELLEETGYIAESWDLFESLQPTSKIDWAIYFFVARGCKRVADTALDGGEKIGVRDLSFDEFLQFARRPDFAERELKVHILEALLDPIKLQGLKTKILG